MKTSLYISLLLMSLACSSCQNNSTKSTGARAVDSLSLQTKDSVKKDGVVHPAVTEPERMIIAGKSIGKTELGEIDTVALNALGKPDNSDAAMGKAWLTWYGKKKDDQNNRTELNIYTTYKDTSMMAKSVRQIRVTSSYFVTPENLHVYSSLDDIKKVYPKLEHSVKQDEKQIAVYDAVEKGIGFEVSTANGQQTCTAIVVHRPGESVNNVYLPH